jgi:hypothetical protein
LVGCSQATDEVSARVQEPVVYGEDRRVQYYEISDPALRTLVASTSIALVSQDNVRIVDGGVVLNGPTWQAQDGLCADVTFGADPVVAYCSGVLIAPDLVLTAGHCLSAYDCTRMALVRNFRRSSGTDLETIGIDDLRFCGSVVAWNSGEDNADDRTDFAWIKLDHPLDSGQNDPRWVFLPEGARVDGTAVMSFGYGAGGPVKLDTGRISDARLASRDFLLTNLDAFAGMSGAPILDQQDHLIGIDNRGAPDLVVDPVEGCKRPNVLPEGMGMEAATYAMRALEALCEQEPRRDICGDIAGGHSRVTGGGCRVSSSRGRAPGWFGVLGGVWALLRRGKIGSHRRDRRSG